MKTPHQIAKIIGSPVNKWPGNCHRIASLFLTHKICEGRLCYGLYHGRISPKSIFGGRPFTHHGWIENNLIVDPTRWAFECVKPYVYIGVNNGEYDFGGNDLKKKLRRPCPPFNPKDKVFDYSVLRPEIQHMLSLFFVINFSHPVKSAGRINTIISLHQLGWLANLPPDMFYVEDSAKEIYLWIAYMGWKAFIPIDNRERICPLINKRQINEYF